MTAPTIDRATFDELKETAGADFVVELVDTFLVEAPAMLAALRSACEARDAEGTRAGRHGAGGLDRRRAACQPRRRIRARRRRAEGDRACLSADAAARGFSSSTTTRSTGSRSEEHT